VEVAVWARDLAGQLLAEPLPIRWAHVQGVARAAESISHIVGDDASLLISAAWLHDVGYAPAVAKTGLHQLDGARHLRDAEHADNLLCRLVANHSYAVVEAGNRGLADELTGEFPRVDGLISDALTYCDMTTSPTGEAVDVESRLGEILSRYGEGNVVAESIRVASARIRMSVEKVTALISN
jgi:HD domain